MKINPSMTVGEFAAVVYNILKNEGIESVLSGGAAVSIYTDNFYESGDADFICPWDHESIVSALRNHGFERITLSNRSLKHPDCPFTVEFPSRKIYIGGELQSKVGEYIVSGLRLRILTPTQSIMDRLIGYIAWKDIQGLDQAEWICERHEVDLRKIYRWAKAEGASEDQLKKIKTRCGFGHQKFLSSKGLKS